MSLTKTAHGRKSPDYVTDGYFSVIFESVSITCYNTSTEGTSCACIRDVLGWR